MYYCKTVNVFHRHHHQPIIVPTVQCIKEGCVRNDYVIASLRKTYLTKRLS
jgi:hypothetical protein